MHNHFANNLRYYRKQNNLTQWQLAKLAQLDRTTITAYESGKRECDFDTLIKLANVLEVSIDDLLK